MDTKLSLQEVKGNMYRIEYINKLPDSVTNFSSQEHAKYESAKGAECNYTPFCFLAKADDEVIGLLCGYTCWEEIYVDDLVVKEEFRGQGIGRSLLAAVESFFSEKDFYNISLVTNAFQAPEFYEKCGFELEFIRKNKRNPKLDKYFFSKFLK